MPSLPRELSEWLHSPAFESHALNKYYEIDVDGDGVLTADEMQPLVESMCGEAARGRGGGGDACITIEHCERFVALFDTDGDGVISRDEFAGFLRFAMVMSTVAMAEDEAQARARAAGAVDDMLVALRRDRELCHALLPRLPDARARSCSRSSSRRAASRASTGSTTTATACSTPTSSTPS